AQIPAPAMTSVATTMTRRWASAKRTSRSSMTPGSRTLPVLEEHGAVDHDAVARLDALPHGSYISDRRAQPDLAPLELPRGPLSKHDAPTVLLDDGAEGQDGLSRARPGRLQASEHVGPQPAARVWKLRVHLHGARLRIEHICDARHPPREHISR